MKNVIRPGAIGLVVLILAGCQTDPQATREIALLRAEILDLEDQYYALKSQHEEAVNTLRAIEGDIAPGTETIWMEPDDACATCDEPVGLGTSSMPVGTGAATIRRSPIANASRHLPPSRHPSPDRVSPIEPSASNERSLARSKPITTRPASATNLNKVGLRRPSRRPVLPTSPAHRVSIDRRITVGRDADDALGDEGIELAVAITDEDDQLTLPDGSLYIQLSTAGGGGDSLTLAEWQFTSGELMNFLINPDLPLRGFLIHLPWQQELPYENQVDVNVSWVGQDGQMLEDHAQVMINPPVPDFRRDSPAVIRWLENDIRWIDSTSGPIEGDDSEPSDRDASRPRWRPVR